MGDAGEWTPHGIYDLGLRPVILFEANAATGATRISFHGKEPFYGDPSACYGHLLDFCRENRDSLSDQARDAMIEFLKSKGATDGRESVPPPHQDD